MTTHDESKDYAKGGIITRPSSAIPPWSECNHLGCELAIPIIGEYRSVAPQPAIKVRARFRIWGDKAPRRFVLDEE